MQIVNYYKLKNDLYDTLDRLYKVEKKLSRRDWTRYQLRLYDTKLDEHLLEIEQELKGLGELK